MKKRIIMLALVVGVMLLVCASAWAETQSVTVNDLIPGYTTVNNVNDTSGRIGREFTIAVKAKIGAFDDDTHSTNAKYLKWTVTQVDANNTTTGTMPVAELAITSVNGTNDDTNGALDEVVFSSAPSTFTANITGTIQATGVVTVTVTLVQSDKSTAATMTGNDGVLTLPKTITFAATDADDEKTTDTTLFTDSTENPDLFDTYDKRDPDSVYWDGLDPTFSNTINTDSYDIGKNKPKLVSPAKTDLTLTPGTSKDLTIKMKGPITLLDVYIAGKDAVKLWPNSGDKDTNIRLTSDNIKAYNIPFRVTSYDFATSVSATGDTADKLKKAQAKAWKDAENTLTLSFNGGHVQYKGFPITISMSNSNTTNKPVAKAVKLNIGSDFTTPAWTHVVTSEEQTTSLDVASAWDNGYGEAYDTSKYVASGDALTYTSGDNEVDETPAHLGYEGTVTAGNTFTVNDTVYILSTDTKVYYTTHPVAYYYHAIYPEVVITRSDKLESSTWVNPDAAGTEDDPKTATLEKIFTASADAPYTITLKPDPTKDAEKIKKFFTSAGSIDIVQPVYNYLGEVKTHGYVEIIGTPTTTDKESKLAFTVTATNPSTKKKGAAKVTASAKTFPVIDKVDEVTVAAAAFGSMDYDSDYYAARDSSFTYDDDNNPTALTYKRIATKRVQAGKAPSVKVKAKGSKTISYLLGKYTVEDGELEAVDDDFNATLATKLEELALSFDSKKGVYAPDKNKLAAPTLNGDGDAFKSLDIVITAVNNVGYDQVWAHVAITGAKPALSGKEVTFALTDKDYGYKTFKLKAGKDEVSATTTTANVKATDTEDTLSEYGLAVVNYDEFIVAVKSTDSVAAGAAMPTGWTPDSTDYAVVTGTVKPVTNSSGDITGYEASTDVTYYNGTLVPVVSPDESLKNVGIVQVVNPTLFTTKGDSKTAKGVKVSLALENFGATNKGSLKVKIPAAAASSNGALPGSMKALANNGSSSSAAKKTNGTASPTYNGALPDEADADEDSDPSEKLTIGEPRTAADLTAGQQAFLAEKGLKIIAVLPEISANVDGQQEFSVELDEDAPEGAKMVYVPFPQDVEETEDDKIADFYGADGEAIEEVPAEKAITVAPWLRAGVEYQPVIAVEE